MSYLAPGGALAAQMPNTARESSHALMRMVAAEGPWSSRLVPIAKTQPLIAGYEDYYDWLRPAASQVDTWMTTYVHPLDGPHSIADWFAGSTLQPFLERLGDDERCEFLARYRTGLKDAYPVQPDGRTLFAYPRLFIVAVKVAGKIGAEIVVLDALTRLTGSTCFGCVTSTVTSIPTVAGAPKAGQGRGLRRIAGDRDADEILLPTSPFVGSNSTQPAPGRKIWHQACVAPPPRRTGSSSSFGTYT